ncbi:MAG TPA: c-type cytochrome biogenesis protein CcmI [Burkholderiales bacterium]
MIAFWIVAGLFVVVAVLLVVPPLLRSRGDDRVSRSAANIAIHRDQLRELEADLRACTLSAELYEQARREIEAQLLEDLSRPDAAAVQRQKWRGTAIALALAIPVCAVGLYFIVGTPQALAPANTDTTSHGLNAQQIKAMVGRLAEHLKANPDDGQGWVMLGRSYGVLGRFDEAASAYANAVERLPNNADVLADYADILAMTQGGRLQGKPETIIERALKVDPNNPKALALAGTVAFEKKDYAGAVRYWERMLPQVQPESEEARSIQASIDEARALGGQGSAPPVSSAAAAASGVSGVVKLAPALADKVAPTDTVFIFARAAEGPRMPLAIVRKQARELPATFKLDDSMAMAPNMRMSNFPQLVVGARISKSSNAALQPGDLQGMSGTVTNGTAGITVIIDTEIR